MDDPLLHFWRNEARAPFEGWDFSRLEGRMIEGQPPWDYLALARSALSTARDTLDMATGGGEVLASLAPFSGRVTAVEGYAPNVGVARARLTPLGVPVFRGSTRSGMPFQDGAFDLVLNRHGGFRAAEVHRIIRPGGAFLTQQVAGDNLGDLAEAFGAGLAYPLNMLERVYDDLMNLGFDVRRGEAWRGPVTFREVGALVYFLKAIPWVVPGFDIETHLEALRVLQARLNDGGPLEFTYSRFLIEAVKR